MRVGMDSWARNPHRRGSVLYWTVSVCCSNGELTQVDWFAWFGLSYDLMFARWAPNWSQPFVARQPTALFHFVQNKTVLQTRDYGSYATDTLKLMLGALEPKIRMHPELLP